MAGARAIRATPLYYVNGPSRMGSAYLTIAADALVRFALLLGHEALFVTGVDEHGEKIAGVEPGAFALALHPN